MLADRWHTCFFDLSGLEGLFGQVQGRTADDVAYWLAGATPAWRDAVEVACIDLCSIDASTVRRMLPRTTLTRTCSTSSSSLSRPSATCGGGLSVLVRAARLLRRSRRWHQEPAGAEPGTPVARRVAKIIDTLDRDRYGQEIVVAWIAKEKLRDVLNLRARIIGSRAARAPGRDRLFSFYDWCARDDEIPELLTLARTISDWENETTAAVITGIDDATSESLNRLAKLEAGLPYGFRNPLNERRRVRVACTRGDAAGRRTGTRIRKDE